MNVHMSDREWKGEEEIIFFIQNNNNKKKNLNNIEYHTLTHRKTVCLVKQVEITLHGVCILIRTGTETHA